MLGFTGALAAGLMTSVGAVPVLFGRAPSRATRDMFLNERGEPRPGASLIGPLAAGVPGSPAGLYELHEELGRLPWASVVAPAIRLARDGVHTPLVA